MFGMYGVFCGCFLFGIVLIFFWFVWCGSIVIDFFICYGEIRVGMCRIEYFIDWNSLEYSWLFYNYFKMSWDSNIYFFMVN